MRASLRRAGLALADRIGLFHLPHTHIHLHTLIMQTVGLYHKLLGMHQEIDFCKRF
jgi:hypothetical protein